jgi:hypothetical protein
MRCIEPSRTPGAWPWNESEVSERAGKAREPRGKHLLESEEVRTRRLDGATEERQTLRPAARALVPMTEEYVERRDANPREAHWSGSIVG